MLLTGVKQNNAIIETSKQTTQQQLTNYFLREKSKNNIWREAVSLEPVLYSTLCSSHNLHMNVYKSRIFAICTPRSKQCSNY